MTRLWLRLVPLLLCAACEAGEGNLLVRFLSERQIPAEADSLEVAVFSGPSGAERAELGRERYPLAPIGRFPATLGINPGVEAPATVLIEAWLYLGDVIVAAGAAEPALIEDATRQVDIELVEDVPLP